jgi:serine/threonine-protein kinase
VILRITDAGDPMPPPDQKPRPSDADVAVLRKWIDAGAPAAAAAVARQRPFLGEYDVLFAIRDDLRRQPPEDRRFLRYFTLTHLHNLSPEKVRDGDLRLYRAALAKLVNSLSGRARIVLPRPVDVAGTVLAVDLRDLDWDRKHLWQEVLKLYPYGLKYDRYPDEERLNDVAREVYELTDTDLPLVRADWFIATASRPPLYHTLARIPKCAADLERSLGVDVAANFRRGSLARAGFTQSGVSAQNRMVERHEAAHGAYWKSYDFKADDGTSNLFQFPLGPVFAGNPFPRQAFVQAGGEIIFNLPNGLQAYMLVDGKDNRIDAGPVEVVSDGKKTSGTAAVINGLSCMACHQHGMIREVTDTVREGSGVGGEALAKVRQLYPRQEVMNRLLQEDEDRFLAALAQTLRPYLDPAERGRDVREIPEPVSAIARWYLVQELGPEEVARELGLRDPRKVQAALEFNNDLRQLGLGPLAQGAAIKREAWESLAGFTSPFQEAARQLRRGTPFRVQ